MVTYIPVGGGAVEVAMGRKNGREAKVWVVTWVIPSLFIGMKATSLQFMTSLSASLTPQTSQSPTHPLTDPIIKFLLHDLSFI